ncbi:MAG: AAA family ATPase [Bacteroidia bacterium]|nr:AAA family ATPase [Bacteroidia bacterium]
MLDRLGISFDVQSNNETQNKMKLAEMKASHPSEYQGAYDLIVMKNNPYPSPSNTAYYINMARMVDEKFVDIKADVNIFVETVKEEIATEMSDLGSEIWQTLSEAIQAEIKVAARSVIRPDRPPDISKSFEIEEISTPATLSPLSSVQSHTTVDHEAYATILALSKQRKNILLYGPSGCGKAHAARQISLALELPYSYQKCTQNLTESVFTAGEFIKIYKNGGVFLISEIDSNPAILTFINHAILGDNFILPGQHDDPMITKHKDFICIATARSLNEFNEGNIEAFRVGIVPMDYSQEVEELLVDCRVLEWGRNIRNEITRNKLSRTLTTKFMIDASDMMRSEEWTNDMIRNSYFADWSASERKQIGYNA